MDAVPYSKREQDEFRRENKEQYENLMALIKEKSEKDDAQAKLIETLCRTVSHDSGQITALWDAHAENKKANALIKDITTVWTAGKWFVYFIIGTSALIVSLKTIIHGGIKEVFSAIKDLII